MTSTPDPDHDLTKIRRLLQTHDAVTAQFRAELAQRSDGEVRFDHYLLDQMRKGKKFKVALRKANAKFPAEALNPGESMADVETHYQFFLDMERIDAVRRDFERNEQQIKEIDQQIAALLESMANPPPDIEGPAAEGR